jgi:CDP-glucose 4,6-dehydratase
MENLKKTRNNEIWNFGPPVGEFHTVEEVVSKVAKHMHFIYEDKEQNHGTELESKTLLLDSSKAREHLGWKDRLTFEQTIDWTINFYLNQASGGDAQKLLSDQIESYYEN